MANKVNTPNNDVIVEAKGKLEVLFEKYGKALLWILVVVGVALGGYFIYNSYAEGAEQERLTNAQTDLTSKVIVEFDAESVAAVADNAEHADTPSANLANFLAAGRFLAEGDMESAKAYIAKFEDFQEGALGAMVNAAAYGLRGDIAVQEGDMDAAVENFKAAVAASDDKHSFITYTEKLARVYSHLGNGEAAMQCYKNIVAKYPDLGIDPTIVPNGVDKTAPYEVKHTEISKHIW